MVLGAKELSSPILEVLPFVACLVPPSFTLLHITVLTRRLVTSIVAIIGRIGSL